MSLEVCLLPDGVRSAVLRLLVFACAVSACAPAFAQAGFGGTYITGRPIIAGPRIYGGGYPPIAAPWNCYPGLGCVSNAELRLILERQLRLDALRQESPVLPPPSTSPWGASPNGYRPPPTAEDQIQPAYRERSVIRPEFQNSGERIQ